jgi:cob(I)alamin adenosyltransferase
MRIYTKTGDTGQTGLFGGARVDKDDLRVESYGTVDELNATLGTALAEGLSEDVAALGAELQSELFVVGAELACVPEKRDNLKLRLIDENDILALESAIDQYTRELPELTCFILPGGRKAAAHLHHARTVCRRAERLVVALAKRSAVSNHLIVYLNRLGDLLFVLARLENHRAGVPDVPWRQR